MDKAWAISGAVGTGIVVFIICAATADHGTELCFGTDGFQHPSSECRDFFYSGSIKVKSFALPPQAKQICISHRGFASPISFCLNNGGQISSNPFWLPVNRTASSASEFKEFYTQYYGPGYKGGYGEFNGGTVAGKDRYPTTKPDSYTPESVNPKYQIGKSYGETQTYWR